MSPQSQLCPTLSPTASSPPAPAPGLWDSERAEGLVLHTNVRSIVKAPLCQRAPLRRLWGGHNGGSVPKFPQTVTCFQSLPPPSLTRPSVQRTQRAWRSGPMVGGGGVCGQYDTPPPWAGWGDGHLTGLTVEGKAWTTGVGVVCGGSWNAGLRGPRQNRGTHSLPMPPIHPAWTSDCPGPSLSQLMDTRLIYAETHRHTLIYAAPHPLEPHTQADVPRYDMQSWAHRPHVRTTFHQPTLTRTPPLPTPLLSLPQLLQQLLVPRHHPPPHPSLPSAALTQVLTSLHLL